MTTTCGACGAGDQDGAFCTVCGTPTGRPARPAVAAPTVPEPAGPPLAGVGRRAAAYVLDVLAVSLLAGVVGTLTAMVTGLPDTLTSAAEAGGAPAVRETLDALGVVYGVVTVVSLLAWLGLGLADGLAGVTIGNALLRIRTRGVDGGPPGAWRGVLRWLVLGVCGVLPLVGTVLVLVSPTFDSSGRRQGWQDKAARSVVVDARRTASPGPVSPGTAQPTAAASTHPRQGEQVGEPPAPLPDPWAFPPEPSPGGGLITGVPGAAEATPATQGRAVSDVADVADVADDLGDLEETRFADPARRPAPVDPGITRLALEIDPDRRATITGRALLGRNPQQDAGEQALLLRVDDPTRSVSKTHLELAPARGALRVRDLGSTNGSAVIGPDGTARALPPGEPVAVTAGWTVQAGSSRFRVLVPEAGA